ncbi:MAG: alpha/beta hydrolase [Acidimicrobiia bacterium]
MPRWNLPEDRPGHDADEALAARRAAVIEFQPAEIEPGVERTDITRGGVDCIVCTPPDARRTILYLHGGGYRMGTAAMWTKFGSRLALAASARVEILDYRVAPEHPFPAAVRDATAAYGELLDEGGPVVVGGDSAGGGLAAAVAVACAQAGVAQPRGLVLISPWADMTNSAATYASHGTRDQMFSLESAADAAALYLQGHAADDPLASPVLTDAAELAGFPPSLVFAGGDEVLLGDGLALTQRLAVAGVSVESHFVAGMQHVWPTLDLEHPEARRALDVIVRFVGHVTG